MANPRVVHLVPALFGELGHFGGGERYAAELARHMAALTPTRLVSFSSAPSRRTDADLEIHALGPAWHVRGQEFNPFHPGLIRHLAWADVVHCHQKTVVASSFAAVVGRLLRRRVFVSDLGGGGWDISAYVSTDRWFRGHLHISQYSQELAGHSNWSRARVIYGGVDTTRFTPDPTVPRENLVVYVGRLMPHKGINDLIEALPDGLTLEIIGRAYHPEFAADLRRLAAGKPVRFRDDCTDAEVVRSYRRAACVVLPSVYRSLYGDTTLVPELLGQTLLEGMACGTATICTAVASMPEVVDNTRTGLVVPPNDPAALRSALEWIRDHPTEAHAMGEAGRQRVLNRFTWSEVVGRCLRAYAAQPD